MPDIFIDGMRVVYSDNVRNLGINMDVNLTFNAHVNEISAKVFARLRSLWTSHHILPHRTKLLSVKSLILPLITYCDSVYSSNLKAKSIRVLERAFAACIPGPEWLLKGASGAKQTKAL